MKYFNQVALLLGRKRIISASVLRSGRVTRGCKRGGQRALEQDEPVLIKHQIGHNVHLNRAVIATPIHIQNHIFGVLCVSLNNGEFDANTIDVIQALSNHVSLIIENLRLNERAVNLYEWKKEIG